MTLSPRNTAIQQTQAGNAAWIPHLSIGEVQDQTRGNRPRPALLGRPGPTGPDRQPQGAPGPAPPRRRQNDDPVFEDPERRGIPEDQPGGGF